MKPLVIANWKMNMDLNDAIVLSGQIAKYAENYKNILVVLAPPAVFIYPIREHLKAKAPNFSLALQDVFYEEEGAFTGEISLKMVKPVCSYFIVGHSERRKYFGETDEIVNRKLKTILKNKKQAVVCIGEKERYHLEDHFDYEVKRMYAKDGIVSSLEKVLQGVPGEYFENISIAYEPVWAIGTANAASGAYASSVCYILKNFLKEKYPKFYDKIRILYGGSVDVKNTEEFVGQPNIDGLLVGGASLKAKDFKEICKITSEKNKS
jgi:triosephosphate isomerase